MSHDRRRIEALLEETAEDLYEHAPCGYLSTLPDGTIARVNQTFLDWTGYGRDTLLTRRFSQLLAVGSRIYYETHYAPLLRMQGHAREIAFDVICADGSTLPVLLNARVRSDDAGAPIFTRITLFDARERRRYEQELVAARKRAEDTAREKGELVAMLSHDIRNPLNAMMGVIHMLDRDLPDDARGRYLRILRSSADNLLSLVNQVLSVGRTEAGAARNQPFSMREVVDGVAAVFETPAEEKGIVLRRIVDDAMPEPVFGDAVALRQVLTNLAGNAVKFTERGSVGIDVRVLEHAASFVHVEIAVSDTGIGLEPGVRARIFEAYEQATDETADRFGGTGLGLTIVRKLLDALGSRIHVESEPGQGSRFWFQLRFPTARL